MNLLRVRGQFAPGPKRYDALLEDPLVSDWISVYRSASTRRNYLSSLHVVCARSGLSPGRLLELEPDDARRVVMDVVRDYLKQDKLVSARMIQTYSSKSKKGEIWADWGPSSGQENGQEDRSGPAMRLDPCYSQILPKSLECISNRRRH